jgi:protein-arginine deiminase
VRVAAWADAPAGAEGSLALDALSAARVRMFKRASGAWSVFDPASGRLSRDELRAGVEFGVEARDFPSSTWEGRVEITLTVNADGVAQTDRAVMRTAPWVMFDSLAPTVRIFGPQAAHFNPAIAFASDLEFYAEQDGMPLTLIDTETPAYLPDPEMGPDVWMQDIMEFGWTGIPGPDGMHAMPVVLRSPNTQRPVAQYTLRELLGPDFGYVWKHATAAVNGRAWDVSLDSLGDLELIPPHRAGERNYPLGRLVHGSVEARHSDVALRQFLEAQSVQGPPLYVDTSWEVVGHVDEFLSFIPADNARGWKLLFASPSLARRHLEAFVARDPRNADVLIFADKNWYYESGPMRGRAYPAERAVGAVLADEELMAFNQMVQGRLDALREQIQTETGVTDDDIVEVPFLWAPHENQRAAAYQPGTVNLLFYGRTAIMARPYGPNVDGRDIVEDDMTERLAAFGIQARFAEQWDLLHAASGEVHCGTNALRAYPALRWWEVAR